jgi:hypothetical protein
MKRVKLKLEIKHIVNRLVSLFTKGFRISLLFLLVFSSQSQAKLFKNLTLSKNFTDIYYDLDRKLKTYQLNDEGWQLIGETEVETSTSPSAWSPLIKSDEQQLFISVSSRKVYNYQLDANGVPIESSRRIVWQGDSETPVHFGYISQNGHQLTVIEQYTSIVTLYQWQNDQYEQIDQRNYGDDIKFDSVQKIHPDGSLINQNRNQIVPVVNKKLDNAPVHPANIEYSFSWENEILIDNSYLFLDKQYNGDYVVKLDWPVVNNKFNYQPIYRGSVDEFEISTDGKWMVYRDFNTYGIVEFDQNFNILNEYKLDADWLKMNLVSLDKWQSVHELSSPIFRNGFLWISNLRIDLSGAKPVVFEQNTQLLTTLFLKYAGFIGYGEQVIVDLAGDNDRFIFEVNGDGDVISRAIFEQIITPELVTGKTDPNLPAYKNISLESNVFAKGNPNSFNLEFRFDSETYENYVDAYHPFDEQGFISNEKFVISEYKFKNGFKVLEYPAMTSTSLDNTFEAKVINQNEMLEIDISEYFELSENAIVSLALLPPGNRTNNKDLDKVGDISGNIISILVDKEMALELNETSSFYILIEEGNWRSAASLPIEIININEAPIASEVAQQNLSINDDYIGYLYDIFTEPDLDPMTYTVSGLPLGLLFHYDAITGSPSESGSFQIIVTATDSKGLSATASFTIQVSGKSKESGGSFHYFLSMILVLFIIVRSKFFIVNFRSI